MSKTRRFTNARQQDPSPREIRIQCFELLLERYKRWGSVHPPDYQVFGSAHRAFCGYGSEANAVTRGRTLRMPAIAGRNPREVQLADQDYWQFQITNQE